MAEGLDQEQLAAAISADRFEWRLHALARIAERGLLQKDVLKAYVPERNHFEPDWKTRRKL